jgi:hypothetical protein
VKVPGLPPLKIAPIKIAKSMTERECRECGLVQFDSYNRFKRLHVLPRDGKSRDASRDARRLTLELGFGTDWDEDALSVLLDTLGVHRGR